MATLKKAKLLILKAVLPVQTDRLSDVNNLILYCAGVNFMGKTHHAQG